MRNNSTVLSEEIPSAVSVEPATISGKFFRAGDETLYLKGVTYGTFAPAADGSQFPSTERVQGDFALMAARGLNAVRLYTPPRPDVLDEAARWGLRLMIGLPWTQHVAFLEDPRSAREIRREVVARVRELHRHPAALLFALGNEIPPSVVRWHGRRRVEAFLRDLVDDARQAAPEGLFTYVNYPPTEFLDLDGFDVCSFNVYLHEPEKLRAYLARLQHIAGHKPLLLAEAGADSIREGQDGQAELVAMHVKTAFEEGACGAFAFAWTDEWWRGGNDVEDWAFGLVDRYRRPKKALAAVTRAFEEAPFPEAERREWPRVSVVVCAYNAADTLDDCLDSLAKLDYPDYEVIVVDDGSKDETPAIARAHAGDRIRVVGVHPNGGLSAARNVGLAHASGEIVAYTDADARADRGWLTYLVQPFLRSDVAGSGGPNVVPPDDPWVAQCVARAPGGPTQVLLDDRIAEHVPGCNMAFRRQALLSIGGFNPVFLRAGDDVDVCWRLQARGYKLGFAPAALVWHHHRSSVGAYWRQQVGYGEGELWLAPHHPDKFAGRHMLWRGRIYSPLPFVRSLTRAQINAGVWGTAAFPSVYFTGAPSREYLPHSVQWQAAWIVLGAVGLLGLASPWPAAAGLALVLAVAAVLTTLTKCASYALASDVRGIHPRAGESPRAAPWRCRAMIAWLHFVQPLARLRGLVRGLMNPPDDTAPDPHASGTARSGSPGARPVLRLLLGDSLDSRFWGESWTGIEHVLTGVVAGLRAGRVGPISVDDGWQHDRDVSVGLGPWARLDLRALIEEHEQGRVLLRVSRRLAPTGPGMIAALGIAAVLAVGALLGADHYWPLTSLAGAALVGITGVGIASRIVRALGAVEHALLRATSASGMVPLSERHAPPRDWARRIVVGLRATFVAGLVGLASVSLSTIVRGALPTVARAGENAPAPTDPADPAVPLVRPALVSTDGRGRSLDLVAESIGPRPATVRRRAASTAN
jgi:GT2 family glycosyltransferase